MNERIRALAEQAGLQTELWHNPKPFLIYKEDVYSPGGLEKFAELIVKECGQWFNNRLTVEPDYGFEHRIERNRAVVGVMKEYNEHFGVEE
jgi:hypothetical protein